MTDVLDEITMPHGLVLYRGEGYIQIRLPRGTCNDTGAPMEAIHGRKWRLSKHMTSGELVRTVFAATLAFMEHELRETFLWRGRAIFGPHIDIAALASVAGLKEQRK